MMIKPCAMYVEWVCRQKCPLTAYCLNLPNELSIFHHRHHHHHRSSSTSSSPSSSTSLSSWSEGGESNNPNWSLLPLCALHREAVLTSLLLPILVSSLDWSEILLNICTTAAPHLERTNIWGLIYQDWYIGTIQERHSCIRQYTMLGYLDRGDTKSNKQPGNEIRNTNIRNKLGVFAQPPTPQPDCFTPWYGNTGAGSPG